jgi:TM2 domain-containing membrane protein YozV
MKGALLSGLIVPGLGQVVLKHYVRGIVLILTVMGGLTILVLKTVQLALIIVRQVQAEGGAVTLATISKAAAQASMNYGNITFNLLFLIIIACWIIGIIDAYIIGRKKDMEESAAISAQ